MSDLLDGLSPAQMAAVTNYQSPSLIIAGAGSGKTRVLTSRIAYMLQQGVAPHSILALTFTNKAATQMKERLQQMVNPSDARMIAMGTFHSIFSRIIRENAELLGYPTAYTVYQTSDAKNLLKSIIKEMNLAEDKYKPNSILSRISLAKNSLVTPQAYRGNTNFIAEDREMRIPHFADIYATYCARCKSSGALDFDDMLLQTNILFRNFPEVLARYQERFQYILVDEYQDTNYAQYIIIRRLAQLHGRVCVVGDDAQSIYSFRGAKIENILNFKNHFPEAKTFKLEQNYRSTQTIVDAANSLISHNRSKLDKRCFSAGEVGEKIRIFRSFTDREEALIVAESLIDRHREDDAPWSEMAILYRNNSQSQSLEQALRQKGIPYQIHRGNSFYEQKEIKDVIAYIRLIINPRDDEAFRRIVNYPTRGIGATTVDRIGVIATEQGYSMWEATARLSEECDGSPVQRAIARKVSDFVAMIRELSMAREEMSLYDYGLLIATRSGIIPSYRTTNTPDAQSAIDNIEELLNTMQLFNEQVESEVRNGERSDEEAATIEEWMQSVLLLTDQLDEQNSEEESDRVTLMTVHSSKGLEYEYIYIVGAEQNLFPSQRAIEMGEVEEERRLFYVAMTRAKRAACVSYCDMRYKWGSMEFSKPSSFLAEIDPKYITLDEETPMPDAPTPSRSSNNSFPDGRYTTPTKDIPRSGERTFSQSQSYRQNGRPPQGERVGNTKEQAIDRLRKQYDFRHQQQKREALNLPKDGFMAPDARQSAPPPPSQPSTKGMRSLGKRPTTEQPSQSAGGGSTTYAVGDRIHHEKFGTGRIVGVEAWNGNSSMLRIDFEKVGEKNIISTYAPIKKI
ncbi:MAG: UvrD-helicase domain-containing protein [Rikenellaceae bacterium]